MTATYACPVCRRGRATASDSMCLRCRNELLVANGERPQAPTGGIYKGRCAGHGITEADYVRMFEEQDGACAICREPSPELLIDHNHATGEVRGLLCHQCNGGIGLLKDSPDIMEAAIQYLEERGCYGRDSLSEETA